MIRDKIEKLIRSKGKFAYATEEVIQSEIQKCMDSMTPKEVEMEVFIEEPSYTDQIDDLTTINGIGKKLQDKLNSRGITTLEQLAELNETDIEAIDTDLKFKGRIQREGWISQAKSMLFNRIKDDQD